MPDIKRIFSIVCMMLTLLGVSAENMVNPKSRKDKSEMVGAYTNYRKPSTEERSLFRKTYKGKTKLTPKTVATQVVAGTNYSFICKDKKGNTYEVIIYEPLPGQGKPEVSSVKKK